MDVVIDSIRTRELFYFEIKAATGKSSNREDAGRDPSSPELPGSRVFAVKIFR